MIEIEARIGDTLLDLTQVDGVTIAGEVCVRSGLVDYTIRPTTRPARSLPAPAFGDRRAFAYVAVSLAVHLAVWGFAGAPDPEPPLHVAVAAKPRLVRVMTSAPRPSREAQATIEEQKSPDYDRVGGGRPLDGDAGRAGTLSPNTHGHVRLQRSDAFKVSKQDAIEQARHAGILGSVAAKPDAFRTLVGNADLTAGYDTTQTQATLYGGTGEANGTFGFGRTGDGFSGGCTGGNCGIIGSGRYGTISNGTATGDHWGGHRAGAGGIPPRRPFFVPCAGPTPCWTADGELDKAIIRRYIKRELSKIQYCYEKELLAVPDLGGTVRVGFLISPSGAVTSVTATGTNDNVASCIGGVVGAIAFPAAKGSTQVTYPFTIRLAGS
ncbi:MAG: AgmX/PglI C-terminal domain-containing protein [Kofleriaceae bacterium]